jgi:hypothetical protein
MIYLFYLFPLACPAGIVGGKSNGAFDGAIAMAGTLN